MQFGETQDNSDGKMFRRGDILLILSSTSYSISLDSSLSSLTLNCICGRRGGGELRNVCALSYLLVKRFFFVVVEPLVYIMTKAVPVKEYLFY